MKKINHYILSAVLLLSIAACKKSFLERAPISQANSGGFYKTPADFESATIGAYSTLQSNGMYGNLWLFMEERSDNTEQEAYDGILAVTGDFDRFTLVTTNNLLSENWNGHYQLITRANTLLERIEGVNFPNAAQKTQLIGEAKFLRALAYFNLVRIYGDVPLVTKVLSPSEAYAFSRTAKAEVYKQIVQDLTEAATALPVTYSGSSIGRATQGAAKTLLGKVHLTLKNYAESAKVLKEVIDAGTYQLLPNYADVFNHGAPNHKESIFEVAYKANSAGEGNPYATLFAPRNSGTVITGQGGTQGYNRPTKNMIAAYETGDPRKNISLAESWTNAQGVAVPDPYIRKYMTPQTAMNDGDANFIVLRYADVLLMYAEVLNETGQTGPAHDYLNMVRRRAGLADKTGLSQAEMRLALEQERRVELAFENHRWFDLVRTGRALEVMKENGFTNILERDLLFPVPQQQIDINPSVIKQNTGY